MPIVHGEAESAIGPILTRWRIVRPCLRADFMSRIRVIHVSLGLNMGGMEKVLAEFARHADRNRFDLEFICLTSKGEVARQIEELGWPVTALGISPGVKPAAFVQLVRLFRQAGANVVHTHNTKPLLYAVPAAHLAGVQQIIHTRHGQNYGITRRQHYLLDFMAVWADRVVSVSNNGTKLTLASMAPGERIVTIENGIDVSLFPVTIPKPGGPIVFVGRLSPEKDLATLLRSIAIAIEQEPAIRLHLAGAGACQTELKALSENLGISRHVEFLGQKNDVAEILAGASMFALSSITEGISLALLEAMSRGLPVVATAVGGNTEVVVDGETGLLVPHRAPAELAAAILTLYRQPDLARQMGALGRKRVEARFDSRVMVARYESLYLSGQSARAAA
jgi:glycosyltransferase involved in cell wall biosynthesis